MIRRSIELSKIGNFQLYKCDGKYFLNITDGAQVIHLELTLVEVMEIADVCREVMND